MLGGSSTLLPALGASPSGRLLPWRPAELRLLPMVCELNQPDSELDSVETVRPRPRGSFTRLLTVAAATYCLFCFWRFPEDTQIRTSRLKRRLAVLLDQMQSKRVSLPSYFNAPPVSYFITGRRRLIFIAEFGTESTGGDEDRSGRLLGRFRRSGLSVA